MAPEPDWEALATEVERASIEVVTSDVLPEEHDGRLRPGELMPVAFIKDAAHSAVACIVQYDKDAELEVSFFRSGNGDFEPEGRCGTTWHSHGLRWLTVGDLGGDVATLGICSGDGFEVAYGVAARGGGAVELSGARWPVMRLGVWLAATRHDDGEQFSARALLS